MKSERIARVLVGVFLLLLVVGPLLTNGIDLLVDWLWFNQEGFRAIYVNTLKLQITFSSYVGLGFIVAVSLNLLIARSLAHRSGFRVYHEVIEFPSLDKFASVFRWVIWVGVLVIGLFVSEWASGDWLEYALAQRVVPMGQADPLFGNDLSYYLFRLPFIWDVYHLIFFTFIICILSAVLLYLVEGGVTVSPRGPVVSRYARAHLMALGALTFLMIAYRCRLAMYGLLYSARGIIYGAGYTDIAASLPVLKLLLLLCVITAVMFVAGALRGSLRPAIFSIIALVAVWLVGGSVYPDIIQRFVVAPNEIEKEQPYIASAIKFTRQAYALDRFEEREFSAVEDLSLENIRKNDATMRNVRLWDHGPLKTTYRQLQEIRTYYDFENVDNDRYMINGVYRQLSLSARELNVASLPSRGWINEHLSYTHGYGLCLSPVNESTSEGLPEFFIKNLPPVSTTSLRITRPEIYYGEMANDYCFVKTHAKEFDYPSGSDDVYTTYQGSGGIPVDGFWRRLLFALKFGEKNILFSSDITGESRLMIYRKILQRANRLTPFLTYDPDPYMVIADDGSLYWMLDGFTTSDQYPYSEPTEDLGNYMRNAVKATVNAYTGQVHFYISDPTDPLIQAYSGLFPGVFEPLDSMPADLRAHIRYPEAFFSIQAAKYAEYHMTDPRVFYNKEDLWRVAQSAARGTNEPMTPYYTIMKLAEVGQKEEFILMVPFTPSRKDNMIAWMAARCDQPNYGKVLVFTFPKQKLIYGPQQIEARVDQDPTISQQLTLWDQHGSSVIRGTLLVIPVLNSVLYVEPIYLAAQTGGGLPQMQRVIVSYSDHVVMETSLDAALTKIFGGAVQSAGSVAVPATPGPGAPAAAVVEGNTDLPSLIRDANQHYERAQQLLRQGDWNGYGEEIKKLGEVLKQMPAPK
ncbi:MAG TPA: UPF0182 family protein [Terriglobia bacterium]|nr:UPF0182 family protein [Terriglobia bacterium]